jgi:hypothetical protein
MKKIIKSILILSFLILLTACQNNEPKKIIYSEIEKADKVEIIHFHSTYQCYSCMYIGDKTLEVLEKNFAKEMENEKIVFKTINVDKKENSEIVDKYKAIGSSLFFNSIIDKKDNISEDTKVWTFIGRDENFENYIINKVNNLIK